MACTEPELSSKFLACVRAFNAHDKTIGGNLAPNVTITTIRTHRIFSGIQAVEDHFDVQFQQEQPNFDPGQFGTSVNGTQGTVTGNGRWKDAETHGAFEPLRYVFGFVCTNGSWLLSSGKSA